MNYTYKLYGLKITSSVKFTDLEELSFSGTHDVRIRKGKIKKPNDDLPKTVYKPFSSYNIDFFYLDVIEIAKFLVKGKDEVVIEKYAKANWQDVKAFLFDTILTVVMLRNNVFAFHASAIVLNKKAYMFCGKAGLGKSTLVASLAANKGGKIIEDDRCVLTYNKKRNAFLLKNQYPFIELWKPQLKFASKIKGLSVKSKVRSNIEKYRIGTTSHALKKSVELDKIILINMTQKEDEIVYSEIKGIKKVNTVKHYTHLDHMIPFFGKNKEHFKQLAKIVENVPVYSIDKSRVTKLADFIKFIEDEIIT